MKITHRISVMACLLTCLLCSCSHDVIYDADYYKQKYVQTFEDIFGAVDSTQMWTTETSYVANVKVSLGTQESYKALVYLNNPLFNTSNAQLLGSGSVSDGSSTTIKFNGPTVQTHYYVAISDSKNRNLVRLDSVVNGVMDVKFGSDSVESTSAKAQTRGISSSRYATTWNNICGGLYPEQMRTSSEYVDLTTVPRADLQTMTDGQNAGQFHGYYYKVPQGKTFTGSFSMQWGVLFVDGTLDLSGSDNLVFNQSKLVISSTGKVILNKDFAMTTSTKLLIEAGGQITSDGAYTLNMTNGGYSYNAGTISMPNGTFDNNGTNLYNCGTINVKNLCNSTQAGILRNFGKVIAYTNDPNNAGAYNCIYVNCCYMKFDHCNIGNFILTDNSRLDVTNRLYLTGGRWSYNNYNDMGNMAEINAGEIVLSNASVYGPAYKKQFAIIKTKKMFISYAYDGLFYNNLYIDWNATECYDYEGNKLDINFYPNYNSSMGYYFVYYIDKWSSEAGSALTIPAGDCTGSGYNDQSIGKELPYTGAVSTLAYEDLGATDDFDFNDIVLYVYGIGTQNSKTQSVTFSKIHVDMVAAGGVLSSKVFFGNTSGTPILSHTDGVMRNTYSYGGILDSLTFNVPSGTTYTDDSFVNDIILEVDDNSDNTNSAINNISKTTTAGKAPQVLHISGKWKWPKERQPIDGVYNTEGHKFLEWVQNHTWSADWYNYPSGTVISAE